MPCLGRGLREAGHGKDIVRSCTVLVGGGGLGEKLLEIFKKIGRCAEETGDLGVDLLYWFGLALVGLEDLKELFVDFGFVLETVLRGGKC